MFAQRELSGQSAALQARSHPGQVAATARKKRNRALRQEQMKIHAAQEGVSVDELKRRLFQEVEHLRGLRQKPASVAAPHQPREASLSGGRVRWDGYGRNSIG